MGGEKTLGRPRGTHPLTIEAGNLARVLRDLGALPHEILRVAPKRVRSEDPEQQDKTINNWEDSLDDGSHRRARSTPRKAIRDARIKADKAHRAAYAIVTKELGYHPPLTILPLADALIAETNPDAVCRCAPAVVESLDAWESVERLQAPALTALVQDASWLVDIVPQIRARREALRQRVAEVKRPQIVAAWLRDLERDTAKSAKYYGINGRRFGSDLADELGRNPAAGEIMEILAPSARRPVGTDALGRKTASLGDHQPDNVNDERADYANPTLDAVLRQCGDWPEHPSWCSDESIIPADPPVDIADLCAEEECSGHPHKCGCAPCVEYKSKIERLIERLDVSPRNRPQPWHPRRRSRPRRPESLLASLARELDTAITAARTVSDPDLVAECARSIGQMITTIEEHVPPSVGPR